MSKVFDVVCIGTGMSALAFAASRLATHPDTRLLLLEKHRVVGGYATQFVRPKQQARFEVSLHKLSGMGPNGNLRQLLTRLGVFDQLEWIVTDSLFDACHTDRRFVLPKSGDAVEHALLQRFPACAEGLQTVFEEIRSYGYDGYMQFHTVSGDYEPDLKRLRYAHTHLKTQTVWDAVGARIADPYLRELLCLPCMYVGGFPEQLSYLYFLHVWYAVLFAGSAYLRGGANALTAALVQRIRELGGHIETGHEATGILTDASLHAYGVVTDTDTYLANEVVVNAAPRYAMDALIDVELAGLDDARAAIAATPAANSTTTLYLVIDGPPAQFGLTSEETMLVAEHPDEAFEQRKRARQCRKDAAQAERAYWRESSIEVTNYHKLDPQGGNVVIVNALDVIHHWPERKTDEYRSKKARAKEILTARLFNAYPSLRGHVRYVEASSPRTCLRYTGNPEGSGYGALVEPATGRKTTSRRFPIGGVRFVGHWAAGSGYEATMGYGAMLGFQV
ncbi:NAD(P)-binding protein [Paraburkholderia agricolaris]|uniref:NAD(P)-binding protein n=1 Tax=Paraburkholderia agricolaris TaxID=2152888 RepID=A0ABW8ZND6_9BURK